MWMSLIGLSSLLSFSVHHKYCDNSVYRDIVVYDNHTMNVIYRAPSSKDIDIGICVIVCMFVYLCLLYALLCFLFAQDYEYTSVCVYMCT